MRGIPVKLFCACIQAALLFAVADPCPGACAVSSTSVNMGIYDVLQAAPADSAGTITVLCDRRTFSVRIDIGPSSGSGGYNPRRMRRTPGSEFLNYNLFQDTARTVIWGDGAGGSSPLFADFLSPNRPVLFPVYGRIPPGQDVPAGQYSDILTLTINF